MIMKNSIIVEFHKTEVDGIPWKIREFTEFDGIQFRQGGRNTNQDVFPSQLSFAQFYSPLSPLASRQAPFRQSQGVQTLDSIHESKQAATMHNYQTETLTFTPKAWNI
jgi:hypothetical protein